MCLYCLEFFDRMYCVPYNFGGMAEETKTHENSETFKGNDTQAPFIITDQYVSNLKFENPGFLMKYGQHAEQPQVSVNVETAVNRIKGTNYEVEMKVHVKSTLQQKDMFDCTLNYCALIVTNPSLDEQALEAVLMVHCPFLMFPFVRNLICDMTRSAGYPPLLIEPIDFAALYIEKRQSKQQN